jgi:hypothetical protein
MCPLLAVGKLHYTAPFDPSITNYVFLIFYGSFLCRAGFSSDIRFQSLSPSFVARLHVAEL